MHLQQSNAVYFPRKVLINRLRYLCRICITCVTDIFLSLQTTPLSWIMDHGRSLIHAETRHSPPAALVCVSQLHQDQFEYVCLHIFGGTVSWLFLLAAWPVSFVKLVTHFHTPDEKSRAAGPFSRDMGSTFSFSCPSALSRSLVYKKQILTKKCIFCITRVKVSFHTFQFLMSSGLLPFCYYCNINGQWMENGFSCPAEWHRDPSIIQFSAQQAEEIYGKRSLGVLRLSLVPPKMLWNKKKKVFWTSTWAKEQTHSGLYCRCRTL